MWKDVVNWRKLLRVTAYVFRFAHNVHAKPCRPSDNRDIGPLETKEIEIAEEYWIKVAQTDLTQRLHKGELTTLSPFVDEKGIYRVGGHVDTALICYDGNHPALLPHKHWISVLITLEAHQSGHPGIAATTTFCRELEGKVQTQFMANLPSSRQQPFTPPFIYSSCDYFSPIKVKVGRNKTAKHYGVILPA